MAGDESYISGVSINSDSESIKTEETPGLCEYLQSLFCCGANDSAEEAQGNHSTSLYDRASDELSRSSDKSQSCYQYLCSFFSRDHIPSGSQSSWLSACMSDLEAYARELSSDRSSDDLDPPDESHITYYSPGDAHSLM